MPRRLLLALLLLAPAPAATAQGLPHFAPINPVATSRSGLGFEPYRDPAPGRWVASLGLDYASTIEVNELRAADYLLDSELLRIDLRARRDLGTRTFVLAEAEVRGSYAGFLDGFLEWYHGLLGLDIPERDARPRDDFLYAVAPPGGELLRPEPSDLFLGDARFGVGVRWAPEFQSVAAVTLPTLTGPQGYGRGVASVSLLNTVRARLTPRLVYEGSLSAGYTARHGRLAPLQRETMVAASSGLRWGFWGRHAIYGNFFYHSPYYEGTTLPALDRRELSFDFGWILATGGTAEWRVGMTEDLEPAGPAIDLVFRLGASF
ncbi:MAG TPA: DUF3187 family protein [Gemmatimonadales bacterium]|nr:DUF3187 family protein [Gemmatimonadales bacterium]